MITYTICDKNGEILDMVIASQIATARIDASKELLEVHKATTEEIVKFTKSGREPRAVGVARPAKAKAIDPMQTDLEDQIRQDDLCDAGEGCATEEEPTAPAPVAIPEGFDFP